jgi:CubicO group peptidase (beta-lactamase class C family)
MPFDQFVRERITGPLKMVDTTFAVPEEKRNRMAKIYYMKDGKMTESPASGLGKGIPWGGMGLYSTIGDYSRFAQMLLNGGELDGARLLGRKTVELMMMNHIGQLRGAAEGFGLGGAVRVDAAQTGRPGSNGLFGWSGAASTYFRVDPKEKMMILGFMQWFPNDSPAMDTFETLAYQAVVQ